MSKSGNRGLFIGYSPVTFCSISGNFDAFLNAFTRSSVMIHHRIRPAASVEALSCQSQIRHFFGGLKGSLRPQGPVPRRDFGFKKTTDERFDFGIWTRRRPIGLDFRLRQDFAATWWRGFYPDLQLWRFFLTLFAVLIRITNIVTFSRSFFVHRGARWERWEKQLIGWLSGFALRAMPDRSPEKLKNPPGPGHSEYNLAPLTNVCMKIAV